MAVAEEKPIAVYGALAANAAIAVTKFIVAALSGSSALFSEGIHSVVDTGNSLLLLFGLTRARRPADAEHPFGYGKEIFFWGLVVAIVVFAVGGGVSAYEGVRHLLHPNEVTSVKWSLVVLGVAFLFESVSFVIAVRRLRKEETRRHGFFEALHRSKTPTIFTVVYEDGAALLGIVVAAVGVTTGWLLRSPIPDGIASIVIGLILASVAVLLAWECRSLLVGESASPEMRRSITGIVERDPAVVRVGPLLTMHLGPDEILVNLVLQFRERLDTGEITTTNERIEAALRKEHPSIARVFIEAARLPSTA